MGIERKAMELADIIAEQDFVRVIAHCDADGITGAAIAKETLDEMGIKNEVKIVRYFSPDYVETDKFTWLIDLGNGYLSAINGNAIITDHHYATDKHPASLNPFNFGMDGEIEISASGLAYLVASFLVSPDASLAVIGAIGDLQDLRYGKLISMNRQILSKSEVEVKRDIRIYGRDKPLYKMLAYASHPFIPGIFGRTRNAIGFLRRIGVDYRKSWRECSREEKKRILSEIVKIMVLEGFSYEYITKIFGEVYEIDERDVREYATLLNSMGKYGEGEKAVEMCIKGEFDGEKLLKEHRKRICKYMEFAKRRLDEYKNLRYFHAGNFILDTVVGTIAGMLLKENGFALPMVAFAENEEGIKVSARAPRCLIEKGINLSIAMKNATKKLGGHGGGHKAAAGGVIPKGMEERFLEIFDAEIRNQLTR